MKKHITLHQVALAAAVCCATAAACTAFASEVLPKPVPAFAGKIGRSILDSKPAWNKPVAAPAGAPNVVLILLDDVGFGATSAFGGAARTPQLEKLAAEGARYNRFHTTAICSPTRAALLTGRNHHQVGYGNLADFPAGYPGYDTIWKGETASVAEVLKQNGYSTAAFGKWHNTPRWEVNPAGPFNHWPTGLGFEYFYGFHGGSSNQWEPVLYRNTLRVEAPAKPAQGYHLTTDLVNDATRWLHEHNAAAPERPYFLYFATGAVHTPHHVPKEWIAKTKGRYDQGWDKLREEIFARQKKLGVIPAQAELTPRPPGLPAWETLSADQKRLYAHEMEVYAAYLEQTDYEVGRLTDAVRRAPGGDNTLILYVVGDNGGSAEGGLDGTSVHERSIAAGAEESVASQLQHVDDLGGPGYNNHYAAAWAWATTTPFQWMKQVAELKAEFDREARRNGVYPLVPLPFGAPDATAKRRQFTYTGDVGALTEAVVPEFTGRSHRIEVDLQAPAAKAGGVLVAEGGRFGGFSLYLKNGQLVYESNAFGQTHQTIVSSQPLPQGTVKVAYEFTVDAPVQEAGPSVFAKVRPGVGRLYIGYKLVGQAHLDTFAAFHYGESFDIGQDRGSAVSKDYEGPFAFNGKISEVRLELK